MEKRNYKEEMDYLEAQIAENRDKKSLYIFLIILGVIAMFFAGAMLEQA